MLPRSSLLDWTKKKRPKNIFVQKYWLFSTYTSSSTLVEYFRLTQHVKFASPRWVLTKEIHFSCLQLRANDLVIYFRCSVFSKVEGNCSSWNLGWGNFPKRPKPVFDFFGLSKGNRYFVEGFFLVNFHTCFDHFQVSKNSVLICIPLKKEISGTIIFSFVFPTIFNWIFRLRIENTSLSYQFNCFISWNIVSLGMICMYFSFFYL